MMTNDSISLLRKAGAALVGVAALVSLSSCGDDKEEAAPAAPVAKQDKPAAANGVRDALLEDLIFGVGKSLTDGVMDRTLTCGVPAPECWDKLCGLLEELQNYRDARAKQVPGSLELARLSTRVAQLRAALGSPKALESYTAAQKDYDAMKDADKKSVAGLSVLCDIKEGSGSALLGQGKSEEAFPYLQQAMDSRKELLFKHIPQAEIPNMQGAPEPAVSEAASSLMQVVRVAAVCKSRMGDPDGAKTLLKGCEDLIKTFPRVNYRMTLQYSRLASTLGDLERVGGDAEAALRAWREAVSNADNVLQQNKDAAKGSPQAAAYAIEAQTLYNALAKAINTASQELTESEDGAEGADATPVEPVVEPVAEPIAEPVAEPVVVEEPAPAPAPKAESAKPAAKPAPAKPAAGNKRNNKR